MIPTVGSGNEFLTGSWVIASMHTHTPSPCVPACSSQHCNQWSIVGVRSAHSAAPPEACGWGQPMRHRIKGNEPMLLPAYSVQLYELMLLSLLYSTSWFDS